MHTCHQRPQVEQLIDIPTLFDIPYCLVLFRSQQVDYGLIILFNHTRIYLHMIDTYVTNHQEIENTDKINRHIHVHYPMHIVDFLSHL
jgi:hypothetical protein